MTVLPLIRVDFTAGSSSRRRAPEEQEHYITCAASRDSARRGRAPRGALPNNSQAAATPREEMNPRGSGREEKLNPSRQSERSERRPPLPRGAFRSVSVHGGVSVCRVSCMLPRWRGVVASAGTEIPFPPPRECPGAAAPPGPQPAGALPGGAVWLGSADTQEAAPGARAGRAPLALPGAWWGRSRQGMGEPSQDSCAPHPAINLARSWMNHSHAAAPH